MTSHEHCNDLLVPQVYRAQNRPVDLDAIQSQLLQSLGMGGAAFDIEADEIGLTLVFAPSLAAWAGVSKDIGALADDCATQTLDALRHLSGLSARYARMLKSQGTTLVVNPSDGTGLLRVKRPQGTLGAHAEEEFATALQLRLAKHQRDVDGSLVHKVVEVAVAVPKRVPVEISRHSVLRLEVIGTGNFSEVHKATISPAHRGGVQQLAAVKTLKSGDSPARAELLREAALMALFEHPNIVAQIGVVTVPRSMPALLVLEFCEHGMLFQLL